MTACPAYMPAARFRACVQGLASKKFGQYAKAVLGLQEPIPHQMSCDQSCMSALRYFHAPACFKPVIEIFLSVVKYPVLLGHAMVTPSPCGTACRT